MPVDSSKWKYRTVGIRRDKTRTILGEGLTKERALAIVEALTDPNAFLTILVEPESEPTREG